jgi:hypothetical protein
VVERVWGGLNEMAGDVEGRERSDEGLSAAKEIFQLAGGSGDGVKVNVSNEGETKRRMSERGARSGGCVLTTEMQLDGSVEREGLELLGELRAGGL